MPAHVLLNLSNLMYHKRCNLVAVGGDSGHEPGSQRGTHCLECTRQQITALVKRYEPEEHTIHCACIGWDGHLCKSHT